uniref:Reverse transcriptase domain-containing protein n=1 Tax=Tanacetum cinerariifolium TaxID=118510 RepID=A0A6L2KIY7_TANCI|nr:reverse transcriptase domain-containing protein [Tanacetum cinerariifolium]
MANTTPIVTVVTKTANKEKTPKEADAALKDNILDFCKEHYEDILPRSPSKQKPPRGIEESYGNICPSYRTGARNRYHARDRDRSRSMKRGRESESLLSRVSESGNSDGGHWKSNSKRLKPTGQEDLAVPWSCEEVDPFTPQICNFKSSRKTRMPNNVKTYDRTGDPEDHVKIFQAATQQKKYVKHPMEIHNIKKRDGETIEDFMERFKVETRRMKGAPECMRISGFMHGVNNPELTKRLNKHVSKTMEEMMTATTAFIRGETTAASKKKGHTSWEPQDQPKRHVLERRSDFREITFPPLATSRGTEGPLVIEAVIGGHMIHRMYVDRGSSTEVLYEHYFNRLRPEIKSQMVSATTSLTGFSGETIWPLGQLRLLVIIEDAENSAEAWMNFMIVRSLSPYNGIIEKLEIREIQAVPSTAHGMLKFSVDGGIVTIRSTILKPTECAIVTTTSKEILEEAEVRHENFKVALHLNFTDQEITIGGTLSAKGRTELCSLLKENLDIFAWQPSDMTGVPRSIAEHRLNIREGYAPVRQKKRGQAPEHARTIQVEQSGWLVEDLDNYHLKEIRCSSQCHTQKTLWIIVKGDECLILCLKSIEFLYTILPSLVDVRDIDETFHTLRRINMELNPKKCTFGAVEGMFLGYMISPEGIKPCPEKTKAVLRLPSLRTIKEVQSLNGKSASLNRFLSKSTKRSLPLFKTLKKCIKKSDFHWTPEAEQAFKQLKQHLLELPMLVAPKAKEELIVYMFASQRAISAVLMTERGTVQALVGLKFPTLYI